MDLDKNKLQSGRRIGSVPLGHDYCHAYPRTELGKILFKICPRFFSGKALMNSLTNIFHPPSMIILENILTQTPLLSSAYCTGWKNDGKQRRIIHTTIKMSKTSAWVSVSFEAIFTYSFTSSMIRADVELLFMVESDVNWTSYIKSGFICTHDDDEISQEIFII